MEVFIVIAILLVLCLILNVNAAYIAAGVLILVGAAAVLLAVCFAYCCVRLAFSRRREGVFLRIDTVGGGRMKTAFYLIDGEEYPCIFPNETIMKGRLYREGKSYSVMLNKKMNRVYDRFAVTTCVLGLLFSTGLCAGLVCTYFILF